MIPNPLPVSPLQLENLHEKYEGKVWVQTSLMMGHRTGEMDRGDLYLRLEGAVQLLDEEERVDLLQQGIRALRKLMPQIISSGSDEATLSFIRRTGGRGVLWFRLP